MMSGKKKIEQHIWEESSYGCMILKWERNKSDDGEIILLNLRIIILITEGSNRKEEEKQRKLD